MKIIPTEVVPHPPKSTSFAIDQCPFCYGERIDLEVLDLSEDKVVNWPMVYILANEDTAYIGQTTSIANRINQHGASEEKKDFATVNAVFNEEFNVLSFIQGTASVQPYPNKAAACSMRLAIGTPNGQRGSQSAHPTQSLAVASSAS